MPKYVNPGAQEAFQEKQAENAAMRISICAELIWPVLPGPQDGFLPKGLVFQRAVEEYKKNGWTDDPFFENHSDSFVNVRYMQRHWATIQAAQRDELRFVEASPFEGIRKANKAGLRATAEWRLHCAQGTVEGYNSLAEDARLAHVEAPLINLRLLPAPRD